jgi:hypothetical protein
MRHEKKLTPRTLDVVITKIVPGKKVMYDFPNGKGSEDWVIPAGSTFDLSTIEVGKRYKVTSKVIQVKRWHYTSRTNVLVDRFDWEVAEYLPNTTSLQAKTAKQSKASNDLASVPLVDTDFIDWGN